MDIQKRIIVPSKTGITVGFLLTIATIIGSAAVVSGKYMSKVDQLEIRLTNQEVLSREINERLSRIEGMMRKWDQ